MIYSIPRVVKKASNPKHTFCPTYWLKSSLLIAFSLIHFILGLSKLFESTCQNQYRSKTNYKNLAKNKQITIQCETAFRKSRKRDFFRNRSIILVLGCALLQKLHWDYISKLMKSELAKYTD